MVVYPSFLFCLIPRFDYVISLCLNWRGLIGPGVWERELDPVRIMLSNDSRWRSLGDKEHASIRGKTLSNGGNGKVADCSNWRPIRWTRYLWTIRTFHSHRINQGSIRIPPCLSFPIRLKRTTGGQTHAPAAQIASIFRYCDQHWVDSVPTHKSWLK